MSVPTKHVWSQGPVIGALAKLALEAALPTPKSNKPMTPGAWLEAELPPRSGALIRDYVLAVGGDPSAYHGSLPAHLFPQWAFPLAARAMAGLPYPLSKTLNAGCRIEQRAPIPAGERLQVRARLESIDDDGKRALITTRIITGTASAPEAMTAEMRAFVPLARREGGARAPSLVPQKATELAFFTLPADAGLDFAKLTGDFNPIHWIKPAARSAGFRGCILHGFATLARAIEAANRALFNSDPYALHAIDARFTKPLPLPSRVGVYAHGGGLWVGDGAGGASYLEARIDTSKPGAKS